MIVRKVETIYEDIEILAANWYAPTCNHNNAKHGGKGPGCKDRKPFRSFEQFLDALFDQYGMTAAEFIEFFPEARRVWEKGKRRGQRRKGKKVFNKKLSLLDLYLRHINAIPKNDIKMIISNSFERYTDINNSTGELYAIHAFKAEPLLGRLFESKNEGANYYGFRRQLEEGQPGAINEDDELFAVSSRDWYDVIVKKKKEYANKAFPQKDYNPLLLWLQDNEYIPIIDYDFYTLKDVADYFYVTEKTIRNWQEKGLIDGRKTGKGIDIQAKQSAMAATVVDYGPKELEDAVLGPNPGEQFEKPKGSKRYFSGRAILNFAARIIDKDVEIFRPLELDTDKTVSTREAAVLTGLNIETIQKKCRKWIKEGKTGKGAIMCFQHNGRYCIPVSELRRLTTPSSWAVILNAVMN